MDCVPLYFVDTRNKAIGIGARRLRGTAGAMAEKMLERMKKEYGTEPSDVKVGIGPSIEPVASR